MGNESYITVKMLTQPTFPGLSAGEAVLKLETAMLGTLDLSILDEDPKAFLWSLQGHSITAEQVAHSLGEIADLCGTTVQIDYCGDVDDARVQTYYVGPGAALEYAADHVKTIADHISALAQLIRQDKVKMLAVLSMFDGTGLKRDTLDTLLFDYIQEAKSSVE